MGEIKILIADDHTMFRQTLRKALDSEASFNVVGEASNGDELLQVCRQQVPDVVLVDLQMPEVNGIEAVRRIRKTYPDVGIIALTMHDADEYLFGAIRAGIDGYVLKAETINKLIEHVKEISSGGTILGSTVAKKVMSEFARVKFHQEGSSHPLTLRETEILQLIAVHRVPKEIARKLFISEKTVRNHIYNIYTKLHCHDRTQAILEAKRLGLIKPN